MCVHAKEAHHHPSCCLACTPHHTHAPAPTPSSQHAPNAFPCTLLSPLPSPLPSPADLIGDTAVILSKERIVPDVIDNISDKAAFKVRAARPVNATAATASSSLQAVVACIVCWGTYKHRHAQLQAAAACILLALSCTATVWMRPCSVPVVILCACLQVSFGESGMVTPGQMLSINDIAAEPKVEITDCKDNGVYAFIMVRRVCECWGRVGCCAHVCLHCTSHTTAVAGEHSGCVSCWLKKPSGACRSPECCALKSHQQDQQADPSHTRQQNALLGLSRCQRGAFSGRGCARLGCCTVMCS